jgi:oligoendopeptidase F
MKSFITDLVDPMIGALNNIETSLKSLGIDISNKTSLIRSTLKSIKDNINSLRELAQIEENATRAGMKVKDFLLRLSLIDGVRFSEEKRRKGTGGFLSIFTENIFNYDIYIRSLRDKIKSIEKSLEDLENIIKEIKEIEDQAELLERANITYDELMRGIQRDLSLVSKLRMHDMDQYISNILNAINEIITNLKRFNTEVLEHSDPQITRLISKILSDVYGDEYERVGST